MLYYHTINAFNDLAVGGLIAYYAFYYKEKFINYFKKLTGLQIILIYIIGIFLIFFKSEIFLILPFNIFYRLILSMFFAFIILEQNYAENSIIKMSWLKTISNLGRYTYGLYLLHGIAIAATLYLSKFFDWDTDTGFLSLGIQFVITFLLSIFLSYISYHFYEKFFLKLKHNFSHLKTGKVKQ